MVYRRKRHYAKKGKRMQKKRMYKKLKQAKAYTKPDGYHRIKLMQCIPLLVNPAGTEANIACNWYQTEQALNPLGYWNHYTTTYDWNLDANSANPEINKALSLFSQLKVTGMKLEYEPQYFQANGNKAMYPIQSFSTMTADMFDTATLPQSRYMQMIDYKTYDPHRRFKRYYKVGKYLRSLNETQWYSQVTNYGPSDVMQSPWTHVKCPVFGFAANDKIGTLTVTYYVKLRMQNGF